VYGLPKTLKYSFGLDLKIHVLVFSANKSSGRLINGLVWPVLLYAMCLRVHLAHSSLGYISNALDMLISEDRVHLIQRLFVR